MMVALGTHGFDSRNYLVNVASYNQVIDRIVFTHFPLQPFELDFEQMKSCGVDFAIQAKYLPFTAFSHNWMDANISWLFDRAIGASLLAFTSFSRKIS